VGPARLDFAPAYTSRRGQPL